MSDTAAADHWGTQYFDQAVIRAEWQAHPLALERLYLKGRVAKRALGIGAGRAETELELLFKGSVEHLDLWDASPVGIEHAKRRAAERGFGDRVVTHVGDFQKAEIAPATYDLVTFMASLHHIQAVEPTLWGVNRALTPDGIIWAGNEYIGPDRFAYPNAHVDLARALFLELPPHLRKDWSPVLPLPTAAEVEAADPSESPCSSRIVPTMRRLFPRRPLFFANLLGYASPNALYYLSFLGGALINPTRTWLLQNQAASASLFILGLYMVEYNESRYISGFAPSACQTCSPWAGPDLNTTPRIFWHCLGAVFLVAGTLGSARIGRFLLLRPMLFLGRVSFGLYLIHMSLIMSLALWVCRQAQKSGLPYFEAVCVTFVAYLTVALTLAALFARWVDVPSIHPANRVADLARPRAGKPAATLPLRKESAHE